MVDLSRRQRNPLVTTTLLPASVLLLLRKAVEDDADNIHGNLSDLSDSTETDDISAAPGGFTGDRSEDYENFEKTLRSKHSKACKAMSVSVCMCALCMCLCFTTTFGCVCVFACVKLCNGNMVNGGGK